jgi:hypothetical protein
MPKVQRARELKKEELAIHTEHHSFKNMSG